MLSALVFCVLIFGATSDHLTCGGNYTDGFGVSIVKMTAETHSHGNECAVRTKVVFLFEFAVTDERDRVQSISFGAPCDCGAVSNADLKALVDTSDGRGANVAVTKKHGITVRLGKYYAHRNTTASLFFTLYLMGDFTEGGILPTEMTLHYSNSEAVINGEFVNVCGADVGYGCIFESDSDFSAFFAVTDTCGSQHYNDAPLESSNQRPLVGGCAQTGSTVGADVLEIEASDACNSPIVSGSHWYSFYAPQDGVATFSTCSVYYGFDTAIHVFEAMCDGGSHYNPDVVDIGQCVGYSDDAGDGCGILSTVTVDVTRGQVYFIAIHSGTTATLTSGTYRLTTDYSPLVCPSEWWDGLFDGAPECGTESYIGDVATLESSYDRLLSVGCEFDGDTTGADGDFIDSICGSDIQSPRHWFSYWANETKSVTFEITAYDWNGIDPDLTIFAAQQNMNGSWPIAPQLGTCLAYVDSGGSCSWCPKLTYEVQSCHLYFIVLDDWGSGGSAANYGEYTLEVM